MKKSATWLLAALAILGITCTVELAHDSPGASAALHVVAWMIFPDRTAEDSPWRIDWNGELKTVDQHP